MSLLYTKLSYDLLLHLEWNLDFTLASSKPYIIPCDPWFPLISLTFLMAQSVKNLPAVQETSCNAGNPSLIPGSERSPGEGNGSRLQYSCLGNPMDRGAWWATVYGVSRVRHNLVTKPPTVDFFSTTLPLIINPDNFSSISCHLTSMAHSHPWLWQLLLLSPGDLRHSASGSFQSWLLVSAPASPSSQGPLLPTPQSHFSALSLHLSLRLSSLYLCFFFASLH